MVGVAARPATFVLTNGQRVSGELTYKGGTDFTLNGRDYPSSEVALISFVTGDPSAAELRELPDSDNPPEHDRHMFVMNDGNIVHGKLYHISRDGETVQFDPRGTTGVQDRRTVSASQIARIYINTRDARSVYANQLSAPVATSGAQYTVIVPGNQQWTPANLSVRAGDTWRFQTTGEIRYAGNVNDLAGPAGSLDRLMATVRAPLPGSYVGALVARIDNGQPFAIGDQASITMPASGTLWLGINDANVSDNSGQFQVVMSR